jgi:cobalt-zinc-cadmium efflux system protein
MTHAHAGAHAHGLVDRTGHTKALAVALALNLGYTVAEAVAGFVAGSLALVADAAHNLSDVAGLAIALLAVRLAARPATPQRSFGLQRAEILSALANGVILVAVSIWVFIEAAQRLRAPGDVPGLWLVVVAGIGIAVNVASGGVIWRVQTQSLNLRAALVHLAGDALASVGVVAAGVAIMLTGWERADPVVSILIGGLILAGTWGILRDAVTILLEGAPRGLDAGEVGRRMATHPGVVEVHDLHVWTITSGFPALSAHVLVSRGEDCHARRRELEAMLERDFGIHHTTLQVDHANERDTLIRVDDVRSGMRRAT